MNPTERAEYLAETYADAILRLSYTYLKNTHDAQDVCQTVFVKLLTEPRDFESPAHERAYVMRMAANACKDLLKSPWRKRTCGLDDAVEVPAPEAEDGSLLAAVNGLPANYRSAIYLYYYEGYQATEIGKILSAPTATIHTWLARGRARLKLCWEEQSMSELFEYKQAMNGLRYTDEQKKILAEQALRAAEREVPQRRKPVWRTALIAAAVAAVLMVGAGATGVLKSAVDALAPIFGGSAAQTEVIDKIGRPIGASATDNGVTITADAIIGDAYNAAIVYTIRRDDGTPLLPEDANEKGLLMGGFIGADLHIRGGSHGSAWFVDEVPGDDTIQLVQTISADVPISKHAATAEFENLRGWDEAAGEAVTLIEGHWKFRFDVDYEDSSVTLGGGETFQQNGMTFTVDSVSVSPVAVKVDYTVDSEVQWSDAPSGRVSEEDRLQSQRYFENVEILLTKKDGTVIDMSNSGGGIRPDHGVTVCDKGAVFDEIIPLEELENISVGGIVYPIPA